MRTRLDSKKSGELFCFLCDQPMAGKIEPIIDKANGKIVEKDIRSYGVVFLVRKK